jgi:hypothetical protein
MKRICPQIDTPLSDHVRKSVKLWSIVHRDMMKIKRGMEAGIFYLEMEFL